MTLWILGPLLQLSVCSPVTFSWFLCPQAFGAVEAMSDRLCIHTNAKVSVEISSEDLLSCCDTCGMGWETFTSTHLFTGVAVMLNREWIHSVMKARSLSVKVWKKTVKNVSHTLGVTAGILQPPGTSGPKKAWCLEASTTPTSVSLTTALTTVVCLCRWRLHLPVSVPAGCRPYSIPPCEHHVNGSRPSCTGERGDTPQCVRKCEPGYTPSYPKDKHYGNKCRGKTFEPSQVGD